MTPRKAGEEYLITIVVMITVEFLASWIGNFVPELYNTVPSVMLGELPLLLVMLMYAFLTPARFSEMIPLKKVRVSTILLSVLITALMFPVVILVNYISMLFVPNTVALVSSGVMTMPMWESILLIGILGPFVEEIVFRGYLFRSLRKGGRIGASILMSALMFGFMHLNFNQASYAFVIGIFLAFLAEASGSVWPTFIVHACFNSFETVLMYVSESAVSSVDTGTLEALENASGTGLGTLLTVASVIGTFGTFSALGIGFSVLIIRGIARREKKAPIMAPLPEEQAEAAIESPSAQRVLNIFSVLGLLFAFAFMVYYQYRIGI